MAVPRQGWHKHDLGMLLVSLLWGANFSSNKYGVLVMPPLVFAAIRFSLASLLLWIIVQTIKPGPKLPARTAWVLAGLGVIGNTGYQILFMLGLVTTTAINASLIMAALPAVVAVLGRVFGVERTTPRTWIGILVATVGVAIVIAAKGVGFSAVTIKGDLLVLLSVFCWASFTVGVRWVGRGLDPIRVTAVTIYGGTPGLVVAAGPSLVLVRPDQFGVGGWVAVVYGSVFAIVIAYLMWSYAVQGLGGSRTAVYNCVIPVFAAAVAWAVLGERPVLAQAAGAILVIAGVLISQGVGARLDTRAIAVAEP
jgi:drug/metabolite transporter (DMT)-like permease